MLTYVKVVKCFTGCRLDRCNRRVVSGNSARCLPSSCSAVSQERSGTTLSLPGAGRAMGCALPRAKPTCVPSHRHPASPELLLLPQGRLNEALAAVEEALAHTPTLIELYLAKAKILKHAGDLEGERRACMGVNHSGSPWVPRQVTPGKYGA